MDHRYDVFISCKSEDYAKVKIVYDWLVEKGHHPFFSPISLRITSIIGEPVVFGDEIDDALEQADNMIVFTSKAEYVSKGYVKDEWRTFVEEQRAGRKTGSLVTILDGMDVADLPIRLRSVQSFTLSNFKEGLLRFLGDPVATDNYAAEQARQKAERKAKEEAEKRAKEEAARKAKEAEERERKERERKERERQAEEEREKFCRAVSDGLIFNVNGMEFKMIKVEGGTFWMGADNGKRTRTVKGFLGINKTEEYVDKNVRNYDADAYDDEKPVHSVTLSTLYMGETVVTQALWKAVMGSNPSYFKGDNLPVESVSWNDCQEFVRKLNQLTGKGFRLPTEAEWEYAARGGKKSRGCKYAGSNTINDVAWYTENTNDSGTRPVKTKSPNELGIYDMGSNVWEWCNDWYGRYGSGSQTNPQGPSSGSNRVLRGGCWLYGAWRCRVSFRDGSDPGARGSLNGFRLCLPQ